MPHNRVTREAIAKTEKLIRPWIRRTPVMSVRGSEFGLSSESLTLKLELFQHAGSFKARGAFSNLLSRPVPEAGVAAASGGNHGVAVAYAAQPLSKPATIFLPSVTSPAKMEKIRGYGAELVMAGDCYADALAASEEFVEKTGAMPIHAFNDVETLLGQGTLAMELEEQAPQIDTLLVAVGGGGLIGGLAGWYRGDRTKLIAVEPESAPTLANAMAAGRPVDAPAGGVAADSLAPRRVGETMFPLAQAYVQRVVLVADSDIVRAQQVLWDMLRIVAEPGGAAAFGALLAGGYEPAVGEHTGVLVCGGNTNSVSFA